MAEVKISGLPTATSPVAATDYVAGLQSGVTVKMTLAQLQAAGARQLANITALRALTGTPASNLVILVDNWNAGDGGGIFRYDSTDTTTADNSGTVIVDAGGKRWKREFDQTLPVDVRWFGFKVGGGTGDAVANALATQRAANAHYWVGFPACATGTTYINPVVSTIANRFTGQGRDATFLVLGTGANGRMFTAVSLIGMIYEDFSIDMNYANNVGSGAHDAIRLESCTRPIVRNMYITGARGLFSGSPVGGGVSLYLGTGCKLQNVEISNCFDNLQATTHTYGSDTDCKFTLGLRFGFVIDVSSDYWETRNLNCSGNSVTDATGHNYSVSNSKHCSAHTVISNNAVLGAGMLIYLSDYFTCSDIRTNDNGLDGCGPYGSLYFKLDGLDSNRNAVRGLTVDSLSHFATCSNFSGTGNGDVDVSVFRSSDFHGTNLNFVTGRVHEAAVAQSVAINAAGAGYTNGTFLCTMNGGTIGPLGRPSFNVTVAGGIVTAVSALINTGEVWTLPSNPVTVTGLAAGAGATFNMTWLGANQGTAARCTFVGGGYGATLVLAKDPSGGIGATNNAIFEGFRGTVTDEDGASIIYANSCPLLPCIQKTAALQNSWVVDTRCVYYKDSDGIVHIEGRIKNGTVAPNTIIFTLPTGYRPATEVRYFVNANGALGQCYIGTDGTVRDLGGSFSAGITGLNGIFFRAV